MYTEGNKKPPVYYHVKSNIFHFIRIKQFLSCMQRMVFQVLMFPLMKNIVEKNILILNRIIDLSFIIFWRNCWHSWTFQRQAEEKLGNNFTTANKLDRIQNSIHQMREQTCLSNYFWMLKYSWTILWNEAILWRQDVTIIWKKKIYLQPFHVLFIFVAPVYPCNSCFAF